MNQEVRAIWVGGSIDRFMRRCEKVTNWPPYWRPHGKPSRLTYAFRKVRNRVKAMRAQRIVGKHEHVWGVNCFADAFPDGHQVICVCSICGMTEPR